MFLGYLLLLLLQDTSCQLSDIYLLHTGTNLCHYANKTLEHSLSAYS